MGISRKQLVIGGRCFVRTRVSAAGGAAVAFKTTPVIVRDVSRGGAEVEFANGKRRTLPFGELEPDHEWLAGHAKKEEEKRERVRREALATPKAPPPLTYTIAEKLSEEEPAKPVSEQTRAEALQQIHALQQADKACELRVYSDEERRAAVELYQEECAKGVRARDAAEAIGIPGSTLMSWAQRMTAGIAIRPGPGRPKGAHDAPESVRQEAIALARTTRMTHAEIGIKVGVSQSTVSRWVRTAPEQSAAEPQPPAAPQPPPAPLQPQPQPEPPAPPPAPPAPAAPPPPPPPPSDAIQEELVALRAENERLKAKVKMLLSMVEGL